MFNQKSKTDVLRNESPAPSGSASIIASGTSMKGDLNSNGDIRIDGILTGNIHCSAKVVIGANGVVEGDIVGLQADIMGKVTGAIRVKELLQLKGGSTVTGNLYAAKLQIETNANFNGQCHMNTEAPSSKSASPATETKTEKHILGQQPSLAIK
ncbi:MAG: polymer-forming cytoskeletal protein [Chitinophagaceae bacterium]|nr:polymer-forming cytoskeletal protein [Chitinophagaceae bacterium]